MSSNLRTFLFLSEWQHALASLTRPFHVHAQAIERSANGVTLHSSTGAASCIAVCSDRVIRVEASLTDEVSKINRAHSNSSVRGSRVHDFLQCFDRVYQDQRTQGGD